MAEDKNYYQILGVHPRISQKELKIHFRKIIKLYHPDLHAGEGYEELYREVLEAYDVLSNPSKRFDYDHISNLGARPLIDNTSYTYDGALGKANSPKRPSSPSPSSSTSSSAPRQPSTPKQPQTNPDDPYELFMRIREAQKKAAKKVTLKDFLLREKVLGTVLLSFLLIAFLSTLTGVSLSSSPTTLSNISTISVTSAWLVLAAWVLFFLIRAFMMTSKYNPAKSFFWIYAIPCAFLYAYLMKAFCGDLAYSVSTVNFLFSAAIFEVIFAYAIASLEMADRIRR
ncbi:MAG: DnaJ domain-containing protein [Synergistaceae bacterium]|jgi:hypothetical protein|nr:DnaJ domain-containing protein [Synergistaceae bacterium]